MKTLFALAATLALIGHAHAGAWQASPTATAASIANARCQILASGVGSGYYAYGSPGFVAGAAIGNAIGNLIQRAMFIDQCMRAQGFEPAPDASRPIMHTKGGDYQTLGNNTIVKVR